MGIDVTNRFYRRQVECLETFDLDGLTEQYHEDALIASFGFTVRGAENIREHFRSYFGKIGTLKLKSTEKFTETGDTVYFEATVVTDHGESRVYDAFVLREGRISYQFTGVFPDTSQRDD